MGPCCYSLIRPDVECQSVQTSESFSCEFTVIGIAKLFHSNIQNRAFDHCDVLNIVNECDCL